MQTLTSRGHLASSTGLRSLRRACPATCRRAQHNKSRATVRVNALFGGNKEGGGGGMNPFDMGKMMESVKRAQAIVQEESQKMQAELASAEFEGFDDEETVRVVMSGNQTPISIDVTQAAVDAGAEELSRRLTGAAKDAHSKSVEGMKERLKEMSKKLGLPGLPNMPNM